VDDDWDPLSGDPEPKKKGKSKKRLSIDSTLSKSTGVRIPKTDPKIQRLMTLKIGLQDLFAKY
jgi:hypothetical protein